MEIVSKNPEETAKLAEKMAKDLKPDNHMATIIGLYGELGSGKTAFTQGLVQTLGITEIVSSPTFVIEKIYKLPAGSTFKHFIHIDAYRLEKPVELKNLGFDDILNNSKNLIIIEWADKVEEILPAGGRKIYFKFIDDQTREIKIKNYDR